MAWKARLSGQGAIVWRGKSGQAWRRPGRDFGMDVRQLRYFLAIARSGSITRAAQELNVAQPALSQQMTNLEAELGVRLLNRSQRGVVVTDAGARLTRHGEAILRQMLHAIADVQSCHDAPSGPVSIGLPSSLALELTLPLLGAIEARHPALEPRIVENHSGYLADLLRGGQLDLALIFEVEDPSRFVLQKVLTEPLYLVSAPGGAFAGRGEVTLADLAGAPLITTTAMNGLRRLIELQAARQGVTVTFRRELDSLQAIKRLVAAGYAQSVLSWYAIREEVLQGRLAAFPITAPALTREVYLARAADWPQSRGAEVVWEMLRALIPALIESDHLRGIGEAPRKPARKPTRKTTPGAGPE